MKSRYTFYKNGDSGFYFRISLIYIAFFCSSLRLSNLIAQSPSLYSLSPIAYFDGITYLDIFFSENQKMGWISGERGIVLVTKNGGFSWKDISPYKNIKEETTVALTRILFKSDNKTGWVIGKKGTLFYTTNGGENWVKVINLKTGKDLKDIHYSHETKILRILNDNDEVFESNDDCRSWKQKTTLDYKVRSFAPMKNSFVVSSGIGFYTYNKNSNSLIDISENIEQEITEEGELKRIKYNQWSDKYIAIYDYGYIFSFKSNGAWKKIGRIDSLEIAFDICFDKTGNILYAIGDDSKLFKSTDAGKHWNLVLDLNHNGFDLYSIICSRDGKNIWVCGSNRTIIHSYDFGKSWKYKTGNYFGDSYIPLLPNNFYMNASFSETYYDSISNLLYSVGNKGIISATNLTNLKSERLSSKDFTNVFRGLYFDKINRNLFAVGENLTIVKYSLSSKKTRIVYKHLKKKIDLNSICFNTEGTIGISVGQESSVFISRDGGDNWNEASGFISDYASYSDVIFRNNIFFIIGENGTFLKYEPDKNKWTKQIIGDGSEFLISIDFSAVSNTGFITSSNGKCGGHLYRSDDNGKKWTRVNNFPNDNLENLQDIHFNKITNEVYITDTYGGIYKSNDNGLNWFKIFPWVTYQTLRFVSFENENNPVFSGDKGSLFVCKKKDFLPKVIKFNVTPSLFGNSYIPEIKLSDIEQNENLVYSLSLLGELKRGSDDIYKQQTVCLLSNKQFKDYPTEIFIPGNTYIFKLTVFDGWNIVTKEIKVKIGKTKLERFAEFMGWSRLPSENEIPKIIAKNLSFIAVLYSFFVLFLFVFVPKYFVLWHEAVANSRLPFPEKLSKFLVLYLIGSDRSLDAFVEIHKKRAIDLFNSHEEVNSRSVWVKAPFNIDNSFDVIGFLQQDNQKKYVPGLSEIKQVIRKERVIIRIEGQGGFGKTSLGLQLCRWAFETDRDKRLFPWTCLPVFIDKIDDNNIDDVCLSKLNYISNSKAISQSLYEALLRKKRIIVIVDGISEFSSVNEKQYQPDFGCKHSQLIIFTSRKPLKIPESTVIYPLGLKIDFLDMLIDSFTNIYAEAYKFGEQREVLRNSVKKILVELNGEDHTKPVALSILKEIIKQAAKFIDEGKILDDVLPKSVSELYDNYILGLFDHFPHSEKLIEDLRNASLISIGLIELLKADFSIKTPIEIKPTWILKSIYNEYISIESVEVFLASGAMNYTGELGLTYIKFKHDPIGEYLASVKILSMFKQRAISIEQLIFIIESSNSSSFQAFLKSTSNRMGINLPS